MAHFTEYGKRWVFCMLAVVVATIVCFPPQRRAGNWVDSMGKPPAWAVAHRLDRFEFGYIPSFCLLTNIGKVEATGYLSKVALRDAGTCSYRDYRWVVDWQWVAAVLIPSVALALTGWYFVPKPSKQISN